MSELFRLGERVAGDSGIYSIAKFDLLEQGSVTKVVFDHAGFPKGRAEHLAEVGRLIIGSRSRNFLLRCFPAGTGNLRSAIFARWRQDDNALSLAARSKFSTGVLRNPDGLRMEAELQLGGCFGAGRGVLPVLQRFFDCSHEHRMTAEYLRLLDLSVGGYHNLHLHDARKAESLRHFGIDGNGI